MDFKDKEYYMKLPYTRELIPEPEVGWFIRIKELPGCMSQGKTPIEAMKNIEEAMAGWIQVELEDGVDIPEPAGDCFATRLVSYANKLRQIFTMEGAALDSSKRATGFCGAWILLKKYFPEYVKRIDEE